MPERLKQRTAFGQCCTVLIMMVGSSLLAEELLFRQALHLVGRGSGTAAQITWSGQDLGAYYDEEGNLVRIEGPPRPHLLRIVRTLVAQLEGAQQ